MTLERANFSAFRTVVRFALVWFCLFPLPLRVWDGLRLVIVALLELFSYHFFSDDLVYNLIRQEKILQKEQNLTELGQNKKL